MKAWKTAIKFSAALCIVSFSLALHGQAGRSHSGASTAAERPQIKNIFWQPNELKQGSPAFLSVEVSGPARMVTGTWLGKSIHFSHGDKPNIWVALAGVDLNATPGPAALRVTAALRNGRVARLEKSMEIEEAQFGNGQANVAQDFVDPTTAERRAIAHDGVLKRQAFAHRTPAMLWNGNFVKPVDAASTPDFGETRLLNEEKSERHMGTDFPVKEGSPVWASNSGRVVLATKLFYEGNCVIVDHGEGMFTVYMHLDKISVHAGERLRKRARIGLTGRTGRVTGPHLHFEAVWNGSHLDPVQLLGLTLPEHEAGGERRALRQAR